jgi:glutathione synthase/RimK-type ligase-like ATP-grasp enzyme
MNNPTNFEVIIVYTERMAQSANSLSSGVLAPFNKVLGNENYNLVYSYFLETCQKNNLRAAFATSADIVGPGMCSSYWLFQNKSWVKVQETGFSNLIFDKFSPSNKNLRNARKLLFSSEETKPFNDHSLFELCFDKQKSHDKLTGFSIPTVTVSDPSKKALNQAIKNLKKMVMKHQNKDDFSDEIVMKNRFGAGGRNVYKFNIDKRNNMVDILKRNRGMSFILQPFVKFDKGFSVQGPPALTDIRLIYMGKNIIQVYTRTAKAGSFKCNEHCGGLLKYISKAQLPESIINLSNSIVNVIKDENSLFALDFIISNAGNTYLLEANTGPGLDWNISIKKNEIEAKKLIGIIVGEIGKRVSLFKTPLKKLPKTPIVDQPIITEYLSV